MARSFAELKKAYPNDDPEVQRVAAAVRDHIKTEYDKVFGIGERLAARRVELGLTQEQVGKRAGLRQTEICRIERGKANPTQATLEKIATALEARLDLVVAASAITAGSPAGPSVGGMTPDTRQAPGATTEERRRRY
jgi:transcriptional regulator with XRE-family HTH domain